MAQVPNPEPYRGKCIELGLLSQAQADELTALQRHVAESVDLAIEFLDLARQKGKLTEAQVEAVRKAAARAGQPRQGLKELAGFEILGKAGEGAMGVVYKARQKSLDRVVALKILPPRFAKDKVFVERFIREARASAALNHPNIVQGIDVGEAQGLYYFAMEFVEGETALQRFKREGPLPVSDVLEIGRQTALALGHAHAKGLIHRDIKPDNLMLSAAGGSRPGLSVKVMDLGLARAVEDDASMTEAGKTLGTPYYISPEQARGEKDLTPACDLYALGGSLLHLATGKPPYAGETGAMVMARHISEPPPNPKQHKPDLPDDVAALLRKLLAKKPAERYPDADALAEDCEALLKGAKPRHAGGKHTGKSTGPVRPVTSRNTAVTTGKKRPVGAPEEGEAEAPKRKPAVAIAVAAGAVLIAGGLIAAFAGAGDAPANQTAGAGKTAGKTEAGKTAEAPREVPKEGPREDPAALARQKAEQERAARQRKLEDLLKAAKATQEREPGNYDKVRRAWLDLRSEGLDTDFQKQADQALDALEAQRKALAAQTLQNLLAEARQLAANGDHDGALAKLNALPPEFSTQQAREALDAAKKELEAAAQAAGAKALRAAEELAQAGKLAEAVQAYAAAGAFKYAPVAAEAKKKQAETQALQVQAQGAAEKTAGERFGAFLAAFGKLAAAQKLDDAQAEITRALNDRELDPRKAAVRSVGESLKAFETLFALAAKRLEAAGPAGVTLSGSAHVYVKLEKGRLQFKPDASARQTGTKGVETLAGAEVAALAGLLGPQAAEFIKAVPKEELEPLAVLLQVLGCAAPARLAGERMLAEEGPAAGPKLVALENLKAEAAVAAAAALDDQAAEVFKQAQAAAQGGAAAKWNEVAAALDLLQSERFAGSAFAAQKRAEVQALAEQALNALAEAEAQTTPPQALFKARARALSGGTIELFYDFEDPAQLAEFKAVQGEFGIKDGKLAAPGGDAQIWLAVPFAGENLEVAFDADARNEVHCLLGPELKHDHLGGYSFRFGRHNNTAAELLSGERVLAKGKSRLNPSRTNQLAVARRGTALLGQLAGAPDRLMCSEAKPLQTKFVALASIEGAAFDNLRVTGKPDPEWLQARKLQAGRAAYFMKRQTPFAKEVQKLFKAPVLDAGGGAIRIEYDFSDPAQLADWEAAPGSGQARVGGGEMGFNGVTFVYHKLRVQAPYTLAFTCKGQARHRVLASARLTDGQGVDKLWSDAVMVSIGEDGHLILYREGAAKAKQPFALPGGAPVNTEVRFDGKTFSASCNGGAPLVWDDDAPKPPDQFNRLALCHWEDQVFTRVTITCVPSAAWLAEALKAAK